MNIAAGDLDRRIRVYIRTDVKDDAGDVLTEEGWSLAYKRWAKMRNVSSRERQGDQEMVRDADCVWTVRDDSKTRIIGPERTRFVWRGRTYQIVGRLEATDRQDRLNFLCCFRPDQEGARAPVEES